MCFSPRFLPFSFHHPPPTAIYTLSLHDALPICSFCLYSRDYRGTPERPGLVLGLDRGGACRGIAYRLPPDGLGPAIDRVWAREMAGEVYRMRPVTVATPQGRIAAYAFVVRRDRPDYAGRLSLDDAAQII